MGLGFGKNKQSYEGWGGDMQGPRRSANICYTEVKRSKLSVEILRTVKCRHLIICPLLVLHLILLLVLRLIPTNT